MCITYYYFVSFGLRIAKAKLKKYFRISKRMLSKINLVDCLKVSKLHPNRKD